MAWLVASAGCALVAADPSIERPQLPDRFIAPWVTQPLAVCLGTTCGDAVAQRVQSAGVLWDQGRFRVVAAVDGQLHQGELFPGWQLQLEADPALSPTQGWQASGLAHPEWVRLGAELYVVYSLLDGSAIAAAQVHDAQWSDAADPLLTA
ncbi:MAG: hypothetical protein HYZ27_06225, partial [Deltaproteobacteria bacterium]|nr:hypothetical protein [Deltaproteobacteria bacterium]